MEVSKKKKASHFIFSTFYKKIKKLLDGESMSNRDWLKEIGEALYGTRHWLAESRPVPEGVWDDLLKALKTRKKAIEQIIKDF